MRRRSGGGGGVELKTEEGTLPASVVQTVPEDRYLLQAPRRIHGGRGPPVLRPVSCGRSSRRASSSADHLLSPVAAGPLCASSETVLPLHRRAHAATSSVSACTALALSVPRPRTCSLQGNAARSAPCAGGGHPWLLRRCSWLEVGWMHQPGALIQRSRSLPPGQIAGGSVRLRRGGMQWRASL